ncbi:Zinc transporter ZIP11 [Lamellibrachia satsuma]|nr:Zinc transporter ZIP11 [Lamellibrachia satsuma]
MFKGYNHIAQAAMGTLFTWAITALGSSLVFVFSGAQRKVLDGCLGFAAGVMTAASYWSLLAPGIEMAKDSGLYGANGEYTFAPIGVGFALGAAFVFGADLMLSRLSESASFVALVEIHNVDVPVASNRDATVLSMNSPSRRPLLRWWRSIMLMCLSLVTETLLYCP